MINIFTESILTLDDRNSVKNYVKVQDYMTCGVVVIQKPIFQQKISNARDPRLWRQVLFCHTHA